MTPSWHTFLNERQLDEVARRDGWARSRLDELEKAYEECEMCPSLAASHSYDRRHVVFGEGVSNADVLIVGIGPGGDEDRHGAPFVGPTGHLLDDFLLHMVDHPDLAPFRPENRTKKNEQLDFDEWREVRRILCIEERIFYTNAVLCRPTKREWNERENRFEIKNRDPSKAELDTCQGRLRRTIYITDPTLIISLGGPALQALMALDSRHGKSKKHSVLDKNGDVIDLQVDGDIAPVRYPLLVLLHPAFLLRRWDEDSKNGYVQGTVKALRHGLRIVDLVRQAHYGIPIPERNLDGRRGTGTGRK